MSNACLTINFKTKRVCIDGKVIGLVMLQQGEFHAQFDQQKTEWKITLGFTLFGHYGNEIFIHQYGQDLAFSIILAAHDGHLLDSDIVKKLKKKHQLNLQIQHQTKISILDTTWSSVVLEYDLHYGLINLNLIP